MDPRDPWNTEFFGSEIPPPRPWYKNPVILFIIVIGLFSGWKISEKYVSPALRGKMKAAVRLPDWAEFEKSVNTRPPGPHGKEVPLDPTLQLTPEEQESALHGKVGKKSMRYAESVRGKLGYTPVGSWISEEPHIVGIDAVTGELRFVYPGVARVCAQAGPYNFTTSCEFVIIEK
jgi:hypothetical protein